MYFPNFSTISSSVLLLASTVSAIPLDKRATANDIIQDVQGIDAGVKILTAHTSAYTGGPVPTTVVNGTTIIVDAATINTPNRKGFTDASAVSKLSTPDSQRILVAVGSSVVISIPAGIEVLKSKKSAYQKAGYVPVILNSLELLLNDHDTFSAALLAKLTLDPIGTVTANGGVALIHTSIQSGIDFYKMK